jgi:hypothetical protein
MSDAAHEQAVLRQEKLENWAAHRVKQWPRKLQIDDYDFRSWAKDASKNHLQAGAIYEYARESRKLRCLLTLMNPKRPREEWEIERPGSIDGRKPKRGEIDTYPAEALWLPCSFDGLNEHKAERALGGFLYALCDLADYLTDNVSFGELFCTKRIELEKAFDGLDTLSRMKREFRYFLPMVEPADVATQSEAESATVEEILDDEKSGEKRIILGEACSEVIAIKIRWRFTNSEIARALTKFVRVLRPQTSKPVQRKKGSRQDSPRSALDALSAMRLASYVPKTSTGSAEAPASYLLGDFRGIEFEPSAIGLFEMVRLSGRGKHMAESNFDALIVEARELFRREFPFGEDAANAPTLAERIMMKSERISSQDKV